MHDLLFNQISNLTLVYVSLRELAASTLSLQVKRQVNTTSSCQAELVALAKGLKQSIYSAYFLAGLGYKIPIVVNQDNQSTIELIFNGKSNSELYRHIQSGYYWVKDLIDRNVIIIEYCPTEFMIANYF